MMRRKLRAIGLIVVFPFITAENSRASTIQCPASFQVNQAISGAVPKGWKVTKDESGDLAHLAGLVFSNGPPQNEVFLTPDATGVVGQNKVDTYKFGPDGYSDIWLSCSYTDTSIMLTERMDVAHSVCRVTFVGVGDQAAPQNILCKP